MARAGLPHRSAHQPRQLSGGEQQRVAIARALGQPPRPRAGGRAHRHPTGTLDTATGHTILDLLTSLNEEGTTIAIVTHDQDIAARLPRRVEMLDGRVRADSAWGRAQSLTRGQLERTAQLVRPGAWTASSSFPGLVPSEDGEQGFGHDGGLSQHRHVIAGDDQGLDAEPGRELPA